MARWISTPHPGVLRLPLFVTLGAALYGALSFVATAGAIVGLGLFAIVLATSLGVAVKSWTSAGTVFVAIVVLILACFQLSLLSDPTFLFMMGLFDPTRAIDALGLKGIASLVTVFYAVNLIVLACLWRYGDVARP